MAGAPRTNTANERMSNILLLRIVRRTRTIFADGLDTRKYPRLATVNIKLSASSTYKDLQIISLIDLLIPPSPVDCDDSNAAGALELAFSLALLEPSSGNSHLERTWRIQPKSRTK